MSETRNEEAAAPVVQSFNEWDPLEEVIVGTVQGAVYPECSPILAAAGEPEWLLYYQGGKRKGDATLLAGKELRPLSGPRMIPLDNSVYYRLSQTDLSSHDSSKHDISNRVASGRF